MSHSNSSLAFAEMEEQDYPETELNLLAKTSHVSILDQAPMIQPVCQVIKVTGRITVSF